MAGHPLARTIERLQGVGGLRVLPAVPAAGSGWVGARELQGTPVLDGLLDTVHENLCAHVPADRRDEVPPAVAPSYVLEWYLWAVCTAAVLPFVHERRVPELAADVVALRMSENGWPLAVALLSPVFSCLPDDPDAAHPDARPVDGVEELRAVLRAQVAAHADAFLQAWGRRGRRGRRALWAAATDALVEAVQRSAPGGRGAREAAALLPAASDSSLAPFVGAVRYTSVGRPGTPDEPFRQRASCCLAYSVPGGEACFSCPRTDDVERARRLRGQQHAG